MQSPSLCTTNLRQRNEYASVREPNFAPFLVFVIGSHSADWKPAWVWLKLAADHHNFPDPSQA